MQEETPETIAALNNTKPHLMPSECERCCGNGEIITDWDLYLSGGPDCDPEAGTEDCPECSGLGYIDPNPTR